MMPPHQLFSLFVQCWCIGSEVPFHLLLEPGCAFEAHLRVFFVIIFMNSIHHVATSSRKFENAEDIGNLQCFKRDAEDFGGIVV